MVPRSIIPEPGQTQAAAKQQAYRQRRAAGIVPTGPHAYAAPPPAVPLDPTERQDLAWRHEQLVHACLAGWLLRLRSPHTRRAYRQAWQAWTMWCTVRGESWLEPRRGLGGVWLADQDASGVSGATRRLRMTAVRAAMVELTLEGLAAGGDPFTRCRQPKVPKVSATIPLADDEVHRAMRAATEMGGRYRCLLLLLGVNGLRASEAAQVVKGTVRNSPWGPVATVVRKGGEEMLIPLPALVVEAAGVEGWPLDGWSGRFPGDRVAYMVSKVGELAGLPDLHPHQFRHWHVTVALREGAPLEHVQDSMDHQSPVTTQGYNRQRNRFENHTGALVAKFIEGAPEGKNSSTY